jgi:hypothetical protein
MITLIAVKIIDRMQPTDPTVYWYGAGVASLFDVFLLSIAVYWLRVWLA